jgi:uncharacterized membrane protein YsdA (DUF1294 family)
MNKIAKIIIFGLLLWLIPFLAGFPFVDAEGNFIISETFFKSIMIVIGSIVGVVLAVNYFKHVTKKYIQEGILLGIIWLIINIAIDVIMIMIEFFPMTLYNYFTDIGLRYLTMPIYTIGLGYALKQRK